jgi:hypothetical protein
MLKDGSAAVGAELALSVAQVLPQDEAFALLANALGGTKPGRAMNTIQGLAETHSPQASGAIRAHLDAVSSLQETWEDHGEFNRCAYEAIGCIKYLLELGGDPAEFEPIVRTLARHPSAATREACGRQLQSKYSWISGSQ